MRLRDVAGWAVLLATTGCSGRPADHDWPSHGGDAGHTQFSPLEQITPGNVSRLQVAWTYRSGDARPEGRSQIQCNPIVVRGVLYATSPQLKVFALDAATGAERWSFDAFARDGGAAANALGVNRGVVYWEAGDDRRILVALGQRLYALDAATGKPIAAFGQHGSVSLKEGLGDRAKDLYVLSNTPGAIYKDLLIIGTRLSEGPGPSAPGHIRAFDVRTGRLRWIFKTIPASRRAGLRHLACRCLDAHRRRQRVERHLGRPRARPGVSADRLGGLRLLGRQPPRQEPVRQLAARARGRAPASASGTTSSCITISGIATCRRRRCWSRSRTTAGASTPSRRRPSPATCSSSIARPARRSSRSKSGPCRRRTSRASRRGRRSRCRSSRRRSRARRFTEADVTDVSEASRAAVLAQLAEGAKRRAVRAAEHAGHGHLSRLRRRRRMGRLGLRRRRAVCSTSTRTRCRGFSRWSRSTARRRAATSLAAAAPTR